ncbi:uncharacterized protein TRAVEDRAFT_49304 [Trametes versicolor FP-101664 SS1]|uniref:uncharacterized protein n=1 Tax=Trametes versicolor (strain FP-101664) TaxID=717944 RepID=UPI00046234B4|nr:uncharacterized protein TRAVEDRAFT_49304 [Trametes versicolor FP-101664 SS1]EIW56479.1 hypothetical protein TRAVEDRAFT_49304 [Trametes versicolor FP-101664 SS1]
MAPSRRRCASLAYTAFGLLALASGALGIGQSTCVVFKSAPSTFPIVNNRQATPILLSPDEWPGVQRAATDFASDIEQVAGVKPALHNVTSLTTQATSAFGTNAIIVGTLGKSALIDEIVNRTKLDVSSIQGKWEAFMAKEVTNPLPGIKSAYVIIGSDKRGTIFAMYDHSEQFGVSPWFWWADVPTTKHNDVFVTSSGCSHGSPTVQYRAIFLNDEQPALQNWAMEKFTNGTGAALTGSPFNHFFYTKLFELILRLKGNHLWPAQWSSAFCVDDAQNQALADLYGIVMGTSHEEPMMRSIPVEWNLFGTGPWDYSANNATIYEFWVQGAERARPFEGMWTVGMRGNGDLPLASAGDNIALLEKVVSDQRQILSNVYNESDVTNIPQVWTLYKEVEGYYDQGLRVPDDITLMWTDDNWGNVRRNPLPSERNRTGGAGVYYHVDYVGDPRDYKWITSSQIEKTFEQMSLAVSRDAVKIWVLNVGDMKPYEMHTEWFLTLAYDASLWTPENYPSFVTQWAQREFDLSASDAAMVANLMHNVTRHNMRRKPELLNSTTYSLINYREADNVMAELESMVAASTQLYNKLPTSAQPAFFQLLHHPILATDTLTRMWISAGMNNLRASQARLSANDLATDVENLFMQDAQLEADYHSLLDGKWDHMMDQTHVMYYYWQQPMTNTMPMITKVQPSKQALAGAMRIVPEGSMGAWPGDNQFNCALGYGCGNPALTIDPFVPAGNRFVDVGAGGPTPFTFTVTSNSSWVKISPSKGSISPSSPEQRVFFSVDWNKVSGVQTAAITFTASPQNQTQLSVPITLTANHTAVPSGFHGFVEGDGAVSIEAAHASRNTTVQGITWTELPGHGRTLSAVTPWPRGGNELNFTAGSGPSIEYDFMLFNTQNQGGNVTVTAFVSPSLNTLGDDRPLGLGFQIDDGAPATNYFVPASVPGQVPAPWNGNDGWVANSIIEVPVTLPVQPGAHTLKVFMIEPTVVLQKILIDTGGVRPSYLGPPESVRV